MEILDTHFYGDTIVMDVEVGTNCWSLEFDVFFESADGTYRGNPAYLWSLEGNPQWVTGLNKGKEVSGEMLGKLDLERAVDALWEYQCRW